MHGFLSVSKEKNVALNFLKTDPSKKAIITILVPKGPNDQEQGFAEMEEFSQFANEREILFNVRSRFTVLETEDQYSEDLPYRHLVLLYGAQSFRKFIAEKSPVEEISIQSIKNVTCSYCQSQISDVQVFFISLTDRNTFVCKACLPNHLQTDNTPLLCVPIVGEKGYKTNLRGQMMAYPTKKEIELPLYGYKCHKCLEGKREKSFFLKCTECPIEGKEKRFCEDCIEELMTNCASKNHAIISESVPCSFWCERMSEGELDQLRFQDELVTSNNEIFKQAEMYFESHKYQKAQEYYTLYIRQNETQKNSFASIAYNNLGFIYSTQEDYKKALEHYFKCLEIKEAIYGANFPNVEVASVCSNIALVYSKHGNYKKALEYNSRGLKMERLLFGDIHEKIAISYNNIAEVYSKQGDDKTALEYHFKALEIRKTIHGYNHPDVAVSLNNIGSIYNDLAEYEKALEYHFKSLEIGKSIYGENHVRVSTSYNNIGLVYFNQGEYENALEYFTKSLEIDKLIYGDKQPNTHMAATFNNIGSVYDNLREYDKAQEYYTKFINITRLVYGENHPHIATSCQNIATILSRKGDFVKAREYMWRSLEINKSFYGENHWSTASSYHLIGFVNYRQGTYGEAFEYYSKALQVKKAIYESTNPDSGVSYLGLGKTCYRIGELNQALEYLLAALDIFKLIHGDHHPLTVRVQRKIQKILTILECP